jgi:hypothetical protein
VRTERETSPAAVLLSIQQHVLHDVWIPGPQTVAAAVVACGLGAGAATGVAHAFRNEHWLGIVGNLLFLALAATTLFGLHRRRFNWCCAAAIFGGISTVAGVGAIWWHRTAHIETGLAQVALCAVAAALLTAHWVSVIVSPLERSQPDMRMAARSR